MPAASIESFSIPTSPANGTYRQLPPATAAPCLALSVLCFGSIIFWLLSINRETKRCEKVGKSHHTYLYRMYICTMYHAYVIPVFAKLSLVTETWGIFDNRHLSLINIYLLLSSPQEANPPPTDEGKILLRTCLAATVFQHKGSKI